MDYTRTILVVVARLTWGTSLQVPSKFKKIFTLRLFLVHFELSIKGVMETFISLIVSLSYNTTLNRIILKIQGVM